MVFSTRLKVSFANKMMDILDTNKTESVSNLDSRESIANWVNLRLLQQLIDLWEEPTIFSPLKLQRIMVDLKIQLLKEPICSTVQFHLSSLKLTR